MKSNKGITLVALVITIIVLLILAGVSISLVVGDNGIMTRAKDAGEKSNKADAESAFQLAVAAVVTDYWANYGEGNTVTNDVAEWVTYARVNAELDGWTVAPVGTETTIKTGCKLTKTGGASYILSWDGTGVPKTVTATKSST